MPTDPGAGRAQSIARGMGWIGTALNVAALMVVVTAAFRLWGWSGDYLAQAGGLPPTDLEQWSALIQGGNIAQRLGWWMLAWISLVGSGACALLAIAGLHWAWHAVYSTLLTRQRG